METRKTPRWSRKGWLRLSDGRYYHPDYGYVEVNDAGDWMGTTRDGRVCISRTRDLAMAWCRETTEGRARRSA